MKVKTVIDKKGRIVSVSPGPVPVLDAKTREVVGTAESGLDPGESEDVREVELPKDWHKLPEGDIRREVGKKLKDMGKL